MAETGSIIEPHVRRSLRFEGPACDLAEGREIGVTRAGKKDGRHEERNVGYEDDSDGGEPQADDKTSPRFFEAPSAMAGCGPLQQQSRERQRESDSDVADGGCARSEPSIN